MSRSSPLWNLSSKDREIFVFICTLTLTIQQIWQLHKKKVSPFLAQISKIHNYYFCFYVASKNLPEKNYSLYDMTKVLLMITATAHQETWFHLQYFWFSQQQGETTLTIWLQALQHWDQFHLSWYTNPNHTWLTVWEHYNSATVNIRPQWGVPLPTFHWLLWKWTSTVKMNEKMK